MNQNKTQKKTQMSKSTAQTIDINCHIYDLVRALIYLQY